MKKSTKIMLVAVAVIAVVGIYYYDTIFPSLEVLSTRDQFVGTWDIDIDVGIDPEYDDELYIGAYIQFDDDGTGRVYFKDFDSYDYEMMLWFGWSLVGTENNLLIENYEENEFMSMSFEFSDDYDTLTLDIYGDDEIDVLHRR